MKRTSRFEIAPASSEGWFDVTDGGPGSLTALRAQTIATFKFFEDAKLFVDKKLEADDTKQFDIPTESGGDPGSDEAMKRGLE